MTRTRAPKVKARDAVKSGDIVRLSVPLSEELHDAAKRKSKETGVSLAHIVRKALEQWIRSNGQPDQAAE